MPRRPFEVRRTTRELWRPFQTFFQLEAASGIALIACAATALVWANSPAASLYAALWETPFGFRTGGYELTKPLLLWINDGLMAVFFFLVGLEIKREFLGGELSSPRTAALPLAGAAGGIAIPALIYVGLNAGGPAEAGWAIPMATDIAFALGVLALIGSRAPLGLKVFLAALAIIDDLAAVLVIALFYTAELSVAALAVGGAFLVLMGILNRLRVSTPWPYLVLGIALWFAILASGMHATIAGVLAALAIPHRPDDPEPGGEPSEPTLLERLEHGLQPWVAFGILPAFALANAGVAFPGDLASAAASPVVAGVFLGLVIGKPLGVFAFSWVAVRVGLAERPVGVSWRHLHGAAWLCGIGFTMSLFIGGLAFGPGLELERSKLAILAASLTAGLVGWLLVRTASLGTAH